MLKNTQRDLRYNGGPCVLLNVSASLICMDFTKSTPMKFRYFKTMCVFLTQVPQFKSLISLVKRLEVATSSTLDFI